MYKTMVDFFKDRKIRKAYFDIAGSDQLIDASEWEASLGLGNRLLTKRMFELSDTDQSGYIDYEEFKAFADLLLDENMDARLSYVFKLCDVNNDGKVLRAELSIVLSSCLTEQGLRLSNSQIYELTELFFDDVGFENKAWLSESEFVDFVKTVPDIEYQFDSFIYKLLGISVKHRNGSGKVGNRYVCWYRRIQNQFKESMWLLGYLVINVVLFADAMHCYQEQGANLAVQIARGCGACLNFNGGLILLPLCKSLITWLRHTPLYRVLPLDRPVDMHKGIAYAIIFFSALHIVAHISNYLISRQDVVSVLSTTVVGITGVVLTVVMIVVWWLSSARKSNYERFVISHLLYSVFLVATLYHGSHFWMWLTPFFLVFSADALYRAFFKRKGVSITGMSALSDQVTRIHFKPEGPFPYYPGDYVKLRIPALAASEWHPFTLSAAPQASYLDVHVRNNGNWSGALNNMANKFSVSGQQEQAIEAELDGPYGAPTSSVYRSRVAVLIAGGIGVTPFASLLQSILLRKNKASSAGSNNQIIHFHWLNRTHSSYSWFTDLLKQAETQLGERRFRLNIHLTSMSRTLSNLVMQIAFDAFWKKKGEDPITGLRARTNAGRPSWDKVFREIAEEYPNECIDVYFCGPPGLGASVRKAARRHGLFYHEEKFD